MRKIFRNDVASVFCALSAAGSYTASDAGRPSGHSRRQLRCRSRPASVSWCTEITELSSSTTSTRPRGSR